MVGHILISFVVILVLVALYILGVKLQAKNEVESQPRVPMFECPKHGFIAEEHLIEHLDNKLCPLCFSERLKVPRLDSTI